jgi:NodT family efflux transporter outer membrane factor (OMF) lipoprotein
VGRVRALSWLGIVLVATGCKVGPDFTRPQATVNANWQGVRDPRLASQTAADGRWWQTFSDPALDRLIERAYKQNLPLQISGLRIAEARAQLGVATGQMFPQLQVLSGSAMATGLSENASPRGLLSDTAGDLFGGIRHFGDFRLGFDAAWELDFWGKYRRGIEAESAALLASVADYYTALVSLNAEVARTYVVIRTFEVLVDQAKENARVQEQALDIAQSRFKNGATSELDVAQATTLLESTRATVPQLQIGEQQARNALSTLLGQQPGTVDSLLAGPRVIPRAPAQVAVGVPAQMLRRRPDIAGAEMAAAAQSARIGMAKAELFPSFTLFGSIGLNSVVTEAGWKNLFSPSSIFYSVGPRIVWPFFNYGRLTNAVRVEDARFQQSLVNYRDTVVRAAQEVEDALAGYLRSQEALVFDQKAEIAARRSVELALVQYREGAADYQRVLDAQRSLLERQNRLAQTNSAVTTNLIALYKALGGGWETRQGQRVVPEQTEQDMKQRTNWGDLLSQPRAVEKSTNQPAGTQ